MKYILLLLSLFICSEIALGVDKNIIAPTGSLNLKGNTTAKIQTYNTGAWQDRISVLNTGEVGIGMTPTQKLHVNGSAGFTNGNIYNGGTSGGWYNTSTDSITGLRYVNTIANGTGQNGTVIFADRSHGTQASPTQISTSEDLFSIAARGYITGVGMRTSSSILMQTDTTVGTYPGGRMIFFTSDPSSGSTERMRIDKDGKVGIGETSPSTNTLTVKGASEASASINLKNTAGSNVVIRTSDTISLNSSSAPVSAFIHNITCGLIMCTSYNKAEQFMDIFLLTSF